MTEAELIQRLARRLGNPFAPQAVTGVPIFIGLNPTPFCVAPVTSLEPGASSATLEQGSFWIAAQLLTPSAPPNSFAGVRISGGVMEFSIGPIQGTLRFLAETQFRFELQLDVP